MGSFQRISTLGLTPRSTVSDALNNGSADCIISEFKTILAPAAPVLTPKKSNEMLALGAVIELPDMSRSPVIVPPADNTELLALKKAALAYSAAELATAKPAIAVFVVVLPKA